MPTNMEIIRDEVDKDILRHVASAPKWDIGQFFQGSHDFCFSMSDFTPNYITGRTSNRGTPKYGHLDLALCTEFCKGLKMFEIGFLHKVTLVSILSSHSFQELPKVHFLFNAAAETADSSRSPALLLDLQGLKLSPCREKRWFFLHYSVHNNINHFQNHSP